MAMRVRLRRWLALLSLLTLVSPEFSVLQCGELVMKSGFRIQPGLVRKFQTLSMDGPPAAGKGEDAILSFPFWMLDDNMRRYWIANRQVAQPPNVDVDLAQWEKFEIKQRPGIGTQVDHVGPYLSTTPFDGNGHRIVTVAGAPRPFIQGITQLRPQSCTVTGLNHEWEFSIATSSLRKEELLPLLRKCVNPEKPDGRFAVVRFLQQAGLYELALEELPQIAKDFPDLSSRCDAFALEARQLLARRLLQELKHRQAAGQHRLASAALEAFPTDKLGADILRELRDFQKEFTETQNKLDRAKHLLGDLQAGLSKEQLEQAAPLRDEVLDQLDLETLPRLEPFLKLEKDETLSASEKLALAYSGWVTGEANATTDFANVVRWWHARFHVLQYLRATHPMERQQALADLTATEGIGPKTIEQLIPRLPPIVETPGLQAGKVHRLTVNDPGHPRNEKDDQDAFKYSVLVPQEFNPHHTYPLIVALHEGGSSPERVLKWWGGDDASPLQSQRHGYIVIAPEYLPAKPSDPIIAPAETIVWECLRDARRRFLIDSDRLFLTGHGRGGEAAFDVALARPDLFAGVIPISGGVRDSVFLKENARLQPWYVVMGEFDFGLYNRHAKWFEGLMSSGCDMLVAQYKSRGHETFYSEIHRLFEWMELHRRPAEPKEFKLLSLRTADVRLHWVRWADTAPKRTTPPKTGKVAPPKSAKAITFSVDINAGQTDKKKITLSGRGPVTLWLNPALVDFDKRLVVVVDGQQRFNDFLKPEIEAVVEDFRQRGDRQRQHSIRLQLE